MTNDIFESVSLQKGHTRAAMISALTSSAVDCGFEPCRVKPKAIKLLFVASPLCRATLMRRSKNWVTRNQDNMSGWGNMYIRGLLFR